MRIEKFKMGDSDLNIPIAENYKDCITLIKSDHFRLTGKNESFIHILFQNIRPFRNSLLFWLRLSSYRGILYPFCRLFYQINSVKYSVQISPFTKIGYGFYIGHGICIVVNTKTIIGNNVNISQFVNIGTNHNSPAIIGDNVYIAPHVSIVENVTIGHNSSIGAGAVVTKDIPENATAVGVPAKTLNFNQPGRYVNRRFDFTQQLKEVLKN